MYRKINCKFNDDGAWCTNPEVKRSLFGLGARCCCEFFNKSCEYKISKPRKGLTPVPAARKIDETKAY